MCTGVVDYQESIPAMPTTRNAHRVVPVRIAGGAFVNCWGGIDANKVNELFQEHLSNYFTFCYLDFLPADFSQFDLTNVNKSLVELRYDLQPWSRSTSNICILIGQNLTGEFMQKIYAASWKLFTLTAEADRVLSQLVMCLTVFFHWMYKVKFSCYQESSVIHG